MKKHRFSWPPRRDRDTLRPPLAGHQHDAPAAAATGPAVRELRPGAAGAAS